MYLLAVADGNKNVADGKLTSTDGNMASADGKRKRRHESEKFPRFA